MFFEIRKDVKYVFSNTAPVDSPDTRDILVASSRGCRACRACRRGCDEDATSKLLQLNLGLLIALT